MVVLNGRRLRLYIQFVNNFFRAIVAFFNEV